MRSWCWLWAVAGLGLGVALLGPGLARPPPALWRPADQRTRPRLQPRVAPWVGPIAGAPPSIPVPVAHRSDNGAGERTGLELAVKPMGGHYGCLPRTSSQSLGLAVWVAFAAAAAAAACLARRFSPGVPATADRTALLNMTGLYNSRARAGEWRAWKKHKKKQEKVGWGVLSAKELVKSRQQRMVLISRVPLSTTEAELWLLFPAAKDIVLLPKGGPFSGRFIVRFRTLAETQVVVNAAPFLSIGGQRVVCRLQGEDKVARAAEEATRTVAVDGLPPSITVRKLWRRFPLAEAVVLQTKWADGPLTGRGLLVFSSPEDARAAAALGQIGPVTLQMAEERIPYATDKKSRTVELLGCPPFTTAEALGRQFPTVEEVSRVSQGRWFLAFPTAEEARAVAATPDAMVGGLRVIKRCRDESVVYAQDKQKRTVELIGCPAWATPEGLREQFPYATEVSLVSHGRWYVTFPTAEEALAVVDRPGLEVEGQPVQARAPDMRMTFDHAQLRTVELVGCPPETTEEVLRDHFEGVERVTPGLGTRWFLTFRTAEEATQIACKDGLTVLKQSVSARKRDEKMAFGQARLKRRTVELFGCPPSTTEAGLRSQFPTAEAVIQATPTRWFVAFPTVAEAEAVSGRPDLQVEGQPVRARMRDERMTFVQEEHRRTVEASGCASSITAEGLQALYPTAEEVLQRRKGRWILVFPTEAEAKAAVPLGILKTEEGPVSARILGFRKATEGLNKRRRTVELVGCPPTTTAEGLELQFLNVLEITRLTRSRWLLTFPTVREAAEVIEASGRVVEGQPVLVRPFIGDFPDSGPPSPARTPKPTWAR